jgi:hypothetical protein
MQNPSFPKFFRELSNHSAIGYHKFDGQLDKTACAIWFMERSIRCPEAYLDFLSEIGPGRFFAGDLDMFPLDPLGHRLSVATVTNNLTESDKSRFFAIGYDGTTTGCYCLSRSGGDEGVYWHDWEVGKTEPYDPDFKDWIENLSESLFSSTVYAGFKEIKDIGSVRRVLEERKKFEVRLIAYGEKLVRPPGKEKDFLPRFHRIVCGVRKREASELKNLTFVVRRTGSSVGAQNVEYATIDVDGFPVGREIEIEAFVFDPFNLRFEKLAVEYSAEIELGSQRRVRFTELREYL